MAKPRPFFPPLLQTGQNIGRRTGLNVLPKKPIPTDDYGLESFRDYFSETEEEVTISVAPKKVSLPPKDNILETPPSQKRKLSHVSVSNLQPAPESSKRSRLLDNEHVVPKRLVWNPDTAEVIDDVPLLRLSVGEMSDEDLDEQFDRLKNSEFNPKYPTMSTPAVRANDFVDALPRQPLASHTSSPAKEPKRAKNQNRNMLVPKDTRDSDGSISEAYDEAADDDDGKTLGTRDERTIFSPPLPPPKTPGRNLPKSASKIPVLVKSPKAHHKLKVTIAKQKKSVARQRDLTPIPGPLRKSARGEGKKSPAKKDAEDREAKERSLSPMAIQETNEPSRYPIRGRVATVQSTAKNAQTMSGNPQLRSSKSRIAALTTHGHDSDRSNVTVDGDVVMAFGTSTASGRVEPSESGDKPGPNKWEGAKTSKKSTAPLTVSEPTSGTPTQRPAHHQDPKERKSRASYERLDLDPDEDPPRVSEEPVIAHDNPQGPEVRKEKKKTAAGKKAVGKGTRGSRSRSNAMDILEPPPEASDNEDSLEDDDVVVPVVVSGGRSQEVPLPDAEDGVVRRSSRVRVPTLAYWRNERIIYEPDEVTGAQKFTGVLKGDNMPEEKAPRKRNKANKYNRRVAKDDDDHHNSELIGEEHMHIKTPITVINPDSQELVAVDCVAPFKSCVFYSSNRKVATGNDAITITKAISQLAFAQGIILIRPYEEKKTSSAKIDTLAFFIVVGTVEVTIHETTVVLTQKDSFFVPRGNKYSMKNPTGKTVELCFFQLRGG